MPWLGVILWRWNERPHNTGRVHKRQEFCVQFDRKRQMFELPKGGAMTERPRRIPMETENGVQIVRAYDSSPFATARWELFEETGIKNFELIEEIEDMTEYELPDYLLGKIWKGKYRGQRQTIVFHRLLDRRVIRSLQHLQKVLRMTKMASTSMTGLVLTRIYLKEFVKLQ